MRLGDPLQSLPRVLNPVHGRRALADRFVHRPLEDRDQQVVFAVEVEVDGACGDAGDPRNVGDL